MKTIYWDEQSNGFEPLKARQTKAETKNKEEVEKFIAQSRQTLLKVSSVFPFYYFDPYGGEIVVDENKINVMYLNFPGSRQVESILYRDVADVIMETSPFFATLEIIERHNKDRPFKIAFLKKNDAAYARRIIQGLVILKGMPTRDFDLSIFEKEELLQKLEELGGARKIEAG